MCALFPIWIHLASGSSLWFLLCLLPLDYRALSYPLFSAWEGIYAISKSPLNLLLHKEKDPNLSPEGIFPIFETFLYFLSTLSSSFIESFWKWGLQSWCNALELSSPSYNRNIHSPASQCPFNNHVGGFLHHPLLRHCLVVYLEWILWSLSQSFQSFCSVVFILTSRNVSKDWVVLKHPIPNNLVY